MVVRGLIVCGLIVAAAAPAAAQEASRSSWGVVGTVVPQWKIPSSLEVLAGAHFSEDDGPIGDLKLQGGEFRVGIARGRALSGDWGVSYVRRSFDDTDVSVVQGGGYRSSGTTVTANSIRSDIRRRGVELSGIEAHKFIAFATIARRVQIGLNLAGGFGTSKGRIETDTFETTTVCRLSGAIPAVDDPCALPNATIVNRSVAQTGASVDDSRRLFKQDKTPIGRVELAAGVVLGSQFKIRVGGGLNYPGTNSVAVTGIYLFSKS